MAKGFKLKLNRANIRDHVLKGDRTLEYLVEVGQGVADRAAASSQGGEFESKAGEGGKDRARAFVRATNFEGMLAESNDKALTKAVSR